MVAVAQSEERFLVTEEVVGSKPTSYPYIVVGERLVRHVWDMEQASSILAYYTLLPCGVTGNTFGFGPKEFTFDP